MESPILRCAFFAAVFFFIPSAAQNSTESPQVSVGWQANPNRRGTLNIIENCFFTILACTWSIQHLNLPDPNDNFRAKLFRKCKWTLLTILFPEFLLAQSIFEFVMAWRSMESMKKVPGLYVAHPWWCRRRANHNRTDLFEWTLTHSHYANMGGFRLCDMRTSHNTLTTVQLAKFWGSIKTPKLSEDDIKDKSKQTSSPRLLL